MIKFFIWKYIIFYSKQVSIFQRVVSWSVLLTYVCWLFLICLSRPTLHPSPSCFKPHFKPQETNLHKQKSFTNGRLLAEDTRTGRVLNWGIPSSCSCVSKLPQVGCVPLLKVTNLFGIPNLAITYSTCPLRGGGDPSLSLVLKYCIIPY